MSGIPQDPIVNTMQSWLNRNAIRAAMVASNLANVDTPGYRARDVSFNNSLAEAYLSPTRSDPNHLKSTALKEGGRPFEIAPTRMRNDGNTVDLDKQMSLMSKLSGRYRAGSEMLRKRFGLLIYTITSRK